MYYVIRCPKCGGIQVTASEKAIKCNYCGARSALKSKGQWKVMVLTHADDARTAGYLVRKLKLMEATGGKE